MNRTLRVRAPTQPDCSQCQLRDAAWAGLSEDALGMLDGVKATQHYGSGEFIYHQGNPSVGVHVLREGTAALRIDDFQGRSLLVRLLHSGQFFGYNPFLGGGVHRESAQALTEVTVCRVGHESMERLLAANPVFSRRFTARMAGDVADADAGAFDRARLPVRARTARLLLQLQARQGGNGATGGARIELPMNRRDLADLLGVTPETVTRTLRALEADGVVVPGQRTVVVRDLRRLAEEAEPA